MNIEGKCDCIPLLHRYAAACSIDTGTITIPTDAWFGVLNNLTVGLSRHCPSGYCKPHLRETDLSRSLCDGKRTGVMCGQCDSNNNLSVQFGSTECGSCSNVWLLSILVYALAGIVFVLLLFALRLTVD